MKKVAVVWSSPNTDGLTASAKDGRMTFCASLCTDLRIDICSVTRTSVAIPRIADIETPAIEHHSSRGFGNCT